MESLHYFIMQSLDKRWTTLMKQFVSALWELENTELCLLFLPVSFFLPLFFRLLLFLLQQGDCDRIICADAV